MKYRNEFVIVALILFNIHLLNTSYFKEPKTRILLQKIIEEQIIKDFLIDEKAIEQEYDNKRLLQVSDNQKLNVTNSVYCHTFKDCFNCSSFSNDYEDCLWANGKCLKDNSPQKINNWWNYFDACLVDMNSIIKSQKYCGAMLNTSSTPIEINLPIVNNRYAAKNIYCKWSLDFDKLSNEENFILNYSDHIQDYESILIVQATFHNKKTLSKTFTNRVDWVLQDIVSLDIHYYTLKNFDNIPFTLKIISKNISGNNNTVVFVTIGVLILICIVLTFIILKCSRRYKNIRNLNQLAVNNQINDNNNNNNLAGNAESNNLNVNNNNANEEVNFISENYILSKNNLEILNKLLSSKIQGTKYTEKMNVFKVNCTICLENFQTEDLVIKLFCKHIFHFGCLKDLMLKNRHNAELKCPNCKNEVLFHTVEDKSKNNTESNVNSNANAIAENRNSNCNEVNVNCSSSGSNFNNDRENLSNNNKIDDDYNNNKKNNNEVNFNKRNKNKSDYNNIESNNFNEIDKTPKPDLKMDNNSQANLRIIEPQNQIELSSFCPGNRINQDYAEIDNSKEAENANLASDQRMFNEKKTNLATISFKNKSVNKSKNKQNIFDYENSNQNRTTINNNCLNKTNSKYKNFLGIYDQKINKSNASAENYVLTQSDIDMEFNINSERNVFSNLNEEDKEKEKTENNKIINNENKSRLISVNNKNHINYNSTLDYRKFQKNNSQNKKDYVKLERKDTNNNGNNNIRNVISNEGSNGSDHEDNKTI